MSVLRCVFRGFGSEEMIPGSVAGCAENIINVVVFVRFHFFKYLVNWMISHQLWDVFCGFLGAPWAYFF